MKSIKNLSKIAIINMGFATGNESSEGPVFKKYTGVIPFFVKGVNMSSEELKKLYPEREFNEEQNYAYNKDGKTGTFVTFQLDSNKEHKDCEGINLNLRATYLITPETFKSSAGDKVQCINKYGDTVWLTKENLDNGTLPDYARKNGFITSGLRPALVGEEKLVQFLRTFINIPLSRNWDAVNRVWVNSKSAEELKSCECGFSLDEIKSIAAGNVTTLKKLLTYQPKNQVKMLCGVRQADNGKEYQTVYSDMPLKLSDNSYARLFKDLQSQKDSGRFATTDFGPNDGKVREYTITMTDLGNTNQSDNNPFSSNDPFTNSPF